MTNVLLCATNAGGVKNLAPVAALNKQGISCSFISNSNFAPLLDGTEGGRFIDEMDKVSASELLRDVDLLICGTTCELDSLERDLIVVARGLSIPSVVVLDEWYNYMYRFQNGDGKAVHMPDRIAVQDRVAFREAEEEGVPAEIMRITGSPALSLLAAEIARDDFELSTVSDEGERDEAIRITFLSETHAKDYGCKVGESGQLGDFMGYTEHSVLPSLIQALAKMDKQFILYNKLHPSSCLEETTGYDIPENVRLKHLLKEPLWPLLRQSDLVVGMRSMALLESAMLGRPTVSFQPGGLGREHCTAVRLGIVQRVDSKKDLIAWIQRNMTTEKQSSPSGRFDFAPSDAASSVLETGLELLEN